MSLPAERKKAFPVAEGGKKKVEISPICLPFNILGVFFCCWSWRRQTREARFPRSLRFFGFFWLIHAGARRRRSLRCLAILSDLLARNHLAVQKINNDALANTKEARILPVYRDNATLQTYSTLICLINTCRFPLANVN